MCGRFSLSTDKDDLQSRYGFVNPSGILLEPRYNIAPSQKTPTVIVREDQREVVMMRWGLVPFWAKDIKVGNRHKNLKAETLIEKGSFRKQFRANRCLILADGFYEWQKIDKKNKLPYRFVLKDRQPFSIAGIWDEWKTPEGAKLLTFALITTRPNSLMEPIHDRMPVILHERDEAKWLDPQLTDTNPLHSPLLTPFPSELMEAYRVSKVVNYYKNDTPECIEPITSEL